MVSYSNLFKFPLQLVIVGKSRSGKSYLLRNRIIPAIISEYDAVFVISQTASLDMGWRRLKNKNKQNREKILLIDDFTPETLLETLDLCGENKRYCLDEEIKEKDHPKYLFICDDVSNVLTQSKRDFYSKIAVMGRHYSCGFIITSHKYNVLNRMIRNNVFQKLFFRITTNNEVISILKDSESYHVKQDKIAKMLDNNTGQFKSFLIESDIDHDNYYVIKADGDISKVKPEDY